MSAFRILACLLATGLSTAATAEPQAFQGLPHDAYTHINPTAITLHGNSLMTLPAAADGRQFKITGIRTHANGDRSISGASTQGHGTAHITLGVAGVFGEIRDHDRHQIITTDASGSWLVELPPGQLSYNQCGVAPGRHKAKQQLAPVIADTATGNSLVPGTVIDILVIYNDAFARRYPGDLLATRVNHLVDLGNQAMANSGVDLGFRLVSAEFFDYSNTNTNRDALFDMASTLSGSARPGLESLLARRNNLGADLVIMLRPHDIEKRGSCGIAFLPDGDPSNGVNVVSDGMSSWSVCLDDVLTHEIGHNLGATHQVGAGGGNFDPRGAAITRPGVLTTIMGSFGTGRPDRFRGVPMFSTPLLDCGGLPCGNASDADNAIVIRSQMGLVEGYRAASSGLPLPGDLPRANPDSDGDGTSDWVDLLPFDGTEQLDSDLDSAGDKSDAFPGDASEQLDTDEDGIGNNADPDDDGDGADDFADAFPLDASETDDDDGDGVGDGQDMFPANAGEFADFDQDSIGNNQDADDDDDGVDEFAASAQDILVISVGNNRILRFDAQTGEARGIEVPPSDGLLTFQSDLAYRPSDHTLHYLSDSSIKRMDLLNRELLGIWVPPYDDLNPAAPRLTSGFPTSLASLSGGQRIVATKMNTVTISAFKGQEQASLDSQLNWRLPSEDSPIDLMPLGPGAVVLGQTTRTLYQFDATNVFTLAGPGAAWMKDPYRMEPGGDGRIFITDRRRHSVVAVDAVTGEFLGDFADLDAQGYRQPTGLAITGSGELLVASARDDAILAFDAGSGDFLGVRVPSGSWGLKDPHAMILVPQLLDRINDDDQRVIRPNAGLWYNPASSGRGFDIQVFGQRLTAIWYTYDDHGLPMWYYSDGNLDGFNYEGTVLKGTLADISVEAVLETVGTLSLEFESERRAQLSFEIGGDTGSEPLQWLPASANPASNDYTGLWGRNDGPGWGVSLSTQGNRSTAIAFIYDQLGEPRWVISDSVNGKGQLEFPMNAVFSDTLCPGCSGAPISELKPAGSMVMDMQEQTWTSDIVFPLPAAGEWRLDATPIILFSDPPVAPR